MIVMITPNQIHELDEMNRKYREGIGLTAVTCIIQNLYSGSFLGNNGSAHYVFCQEKEYIEKIAPEIYEKLVEIFKDHTPM